MPRINVKGPDWELMDKLTTVMRDYALAQPGGRVPAEDGISVLATMIGYIAAGNNTSEAGQMAYFTVAKAVILLTIRKCAADDAGTELTMDMIIKAIKDATGGEFDHVTGEVKDAPVIH